MAEVNLLRNYPKSKRDLKSRAEKKSGAVRRIARQFGKEFFDGDRQYGYGGFSYHPRFWQPVIPDFRRRYGLSSRSSLLDVGCAKGFMLHDFRELIPEITVAGIDISEYAISHAMEDVKPFVRVGDAGNLPYPDATFDLVVSINTIHNLPLRELRRALREIIRVSRRHAFVTVDAYRNEREQQRMYDWNLTAKTIMSVTEWKGLFRSVGYKGDFYWFFP